MLGEFSGLESWVLVSWLAGSVWSGSRGLISGMYPAGLAGVAGGVFAEGMGFFVGGG